MAEGLSQIRMLFDILKSGPNHSSLESIRTRKINEVSDLEVRSLAVLRLAQIEGRQTHLPETDNAFQQVTVLVTAM